MLRTLNTDKTPKKRANYLLVHEAEDQRRSRTQQVPPYDPFLFPCHPDTRENSIVFADIRQNMQRYLGDVVLQPHHNVALQ